MVDQLRKALKRNPLLLREDFGRNGLAHAATYRKHFGSVTEAYCLAQTGLTPVSASSIPSIRVSKRFFLRDLYQALASRGVSVEPKPYENLLLVSGVAVRPRSAETTRDRRGSRYWLVEKFQPVTTGVRPWLLVLCGEGTPIATHYFLLSPDQQATFDGRIQAIESGHNSPYLAFDPSELIDHLRRAIIEPRSTQEL
jgi:hypothetical protein